MEGDYGQVMSWMNINKSRLLLDIHVGEHVNKIFEAIRDRCVLQYISPYVSLSLSSMSTAFSMDVSSMESAVASLISSGRLNARIDSAAKTVHVVTTERRAESFAKVNLFKLNIVRWSTCPTHSQSHSKFRWRN
jgi:COP9 signalosome complex subunit 1